MDIIKEIKSRLLEKYDVCYMQGMTLEQNGNQYILTVDLNNSDKPLYLSGEFESDEKFVNFIMEEFRIRKPFPRYGWQYFVVKRVQEPVGEKELNKILEEGKILIQ